MRMDYFLWAIVGAGRTYVVDCGFTAEVAVQRKREFLRTAVDALALIDIDAATVEDLIITHLHYDHVGNFACFPKANIHLQEPELAYATGRYMRHPFMSHAFEVEDVVGIVRLNYAGRVDFHNGVSNLAPGLSLHWRAGIRPDCNSCGFIPSGVGCAASDVVHYFENMEARRPFSTAFNVGDHARGLRHGEVAGIEPRSRHSGP